MIATTYSGVSRAAGLLRAFHTDDAETFHAVMAAEQDLESGGNPWHTFSALLAMADRLIDYATQLRPEHAYEDVLAEVTRLMLTALDIDEKGQDS